MGSEAEREYPQRLYHETPGRAGAGACFHVRLRAAPNNPFPFTSPELGTKLLEAVAAYHEQGRWFASVFLLMPDHVHALLAFPPTLAMSRVVGDWKRFIARADGVWWQTNYFDHRLRHEKERAETYGYILRNPVVKGLCAKEDEWPWIFRPSD